MVGEGWHPSMGGMGGRVLAVLRRFLTAERVIQAVRMVVPAALLLLLNPFNLLEDSAETSERIISAILAPYYPFRAGEYVNGRTSIAEANRNKITVIQIDQDDVRSGLIGAGKSWPPPLTIYGTLLRKIANHHPDAIFVDLNLGPRDAGDVTHFTTLLDSLRSRVPIYLACIPRDPTDILPATDGDSPTRLSASCGTWWGQAPTSGVDNPSAQDLTRRIFVSWPRQGMSYPLCVNGYADDRSAVLAPDAEANRGWHLTPAARLWRATLARHTDDARAQKTLAWLDQQCPGAAQPEFHSPALTVLWGATIPEEMGKYGLDDSECLAHPMASTWDKFHAGLTLVVHGFTAHLNHDDGAPGNDPALPWNVLSRCAYHLTFTLRALQELSRDEAAMTEAIQGRVILIGAALPGIPDYWRSPAHGTVAGVQLHAMALDNLLNFGPSFVVEMGHGAMHAVGLMLELVLMICAGFMVSAPAVTLVYPELARKHHGTNVYQARLIAGVLLIFGIGAIAATASVLGASHFTIVTAIMVSSGAIIIIAAHFTPRLYRRRHLLHPHLRALLLVWTSAGLAIGAFALFFTLSLPIAIVSLVVFSTSPMFWLPCVMIALAATMGEPLVKTMEIAQEEIKNLTRYRRAKTLLRRLHHEA